MTSILETVAGAIRVVKLYGDDDSHEYLDGGAALAQAALDSLPLIILPWDAEPEMNDTVVYGGSRCWSECGILLRALLVCNSDNNGSSNGD